MTFALRKRKAIGRMKRSYFGGLRVNVSPTKVGFVTTRFHCFASTTTQIIQVIRQSRRLQTFPFSRTLYSEHLLVCNRPDLRNGHVPLPCLFLSLLLDCIAEYLGMRNIFAVKKVGGKSAIGRCLGMFNRAFRVEFDPTTIRGNCCQNVKTQTSCALRPSPCNVAYYTVLPSNRELFVRIESAHAQNALASFAYIDCVSEDMEKV